MTTFRLYYGPFDEVLITVKTLIAAVRRIAAVGAVLWLLALHSSTATDWPQFLGPTHDLASTERIVTNWPAAGLAQRWSAALAGNSSFAVSQGRAFTLVRRDLDAIHRQELCLALDTLTGRVLWS